jgi:hypothetical protein
MARLLTCGRKATPHARHASRHSLRKTRSIVGAECVLTTPRSSVVTRRWSTNERPRGNGATAPDDSYDGLGRVLDEVEGFLRRFVSLTESRAIAVALWVVL